jgi:hypothetical protein
MSGEVGLPVVAVLATLSVHELDAVSHREWRFLLAPLPVGDETAARLFVAAHAPLFGVLFWSLGSPAVQTGLDAFALVHAILHVALRDHPALEFEGWFSWSWILGAGLLGGGHLVWTILP